jgi:hypothetical protein
MSQQKSNFEEMTIKQLRNYILANGEDEDALHAIAMRLRNQGTTATVDEYLEHIKQQSSNMLDKGFFVGWASLPALV